VGKTSSKVTLWSREGQLLDRKVRPNAGIEDGAVRRLDSSGIASWLVKALASYAGHPVRFIVPVAHGAGVAAIREGALAVPPLDYEQSIPSTVLDAYQAERDRFSITGSPALPDGLNLGSQLFWLEQSQPDAMVGSTLLPWAQYWAWFLSGTASSEVTSLGCHSDLWEPMESAFSPMAKRMGWAERFAPLVKAGDVIGMLRPELAEHTGLPVSTKILAGLHDSNAALLAARGYAEISGNEATVLSTGTWFVAMRLTDETVPTASLAEDRDCLVNVDAYGRLVPSARFMGGREIEMLVGSNAQSVDIKTDQPALLAAVPQLLENGVMVLPTQVSGCGPFPVHAHRWIGEPRDNSALRAVTCLYAALMADASLDLIGSKDRLLVEGRFAEAEVFVRALADLRPDTTVYTASAQTDVSFGALRLINSGLRPQGELQAVKPLEGNIASYRDHWRAALEQQA